MERSGIKIASVLPPRHASTFFQSFIPQKRFCGLGYEHEREYIEDVGYLFYRHFSYENYARCSHRHRHIISIRNPLDAALSYYDNFIRHDEVSVEEFLLSRWRPTLLHYARGSAPSDYDAICSVEDISSSLLFLSKLGLITNDKPRNVGRRKNKRFFYEKEFIEKFDSEYEVYYSFLEEFNRRKSVIL